MSIRRPVERPKAAPQACRTPGSSVLRTIQRARRADSYAESDAGFTLIEALVSFAIFGMVTAAAVLAVVTGITGQNATRDRVTAANVAQQSINQAQAMTRTALTAQSTVTSTSTVGSEPYRVTRTVSFSSGTSCPAQPTVASPRSIHVAVVVTWPGSNGRSVQMDWVRAC